MPDYRVVIQQQTYDKAASYKTQLQHGAPAGYFL